MIFAEIEAIRSDSLADYEAAFSSLVEKNVVGEVLADCLGKFTGDSANPFGNFTANDGQIILYKDAHVVLEIRYVPAVKLISDATRDGILIASSPTDVITTVVGTGCVEIDLYEMEKSVDPAIFDRTASIRKIDRLTLTSGKFLTVMRGHNLISLLRIDEGVILFQISTAKQDPLIWHFDATTGLAKHATSASAEASRQEFSVAALRYLGWTDAIDEIEAFAIDSSYHFVRMAALRHLTSMDYARGRAALDRAAANDPHPHVRNAVIRTIKNLDSASLNGGN
jgi:hypothetical protein